MRAAGKATVWLLALHLVACGVPAKEDAAAADLPAPDALLPVPYPDLEPFDTQVQERLRAVRADLEAAYDPDSGSADARARAFGEGGQVYHAHRLWSAAEICYADALALAAQPRWEYLLGDVLRSTGNLDGAVAHWTRFLTAEPDAIAAWVRLGRTELERGRPAEADEAFRRALDLDGSVAAALAGRGRVAAAQGDVDEAIRLLEAALEIAPEATEINHALGLAYRSRGERERAQRHLAVRGPTPAPFDPLLDELQRLREGARVRQFRSSELFAAGRYAEARVELENAVTADPGDATLRTNLARTLIMSGELDAAEEQLREALRLDPGFAHAHLNLGSLYAQRGDDERAAEHLREAIELDPSQVAARLDLAAALRRSGRPGDAIALYREAIPLDPSAVRPRLHEALTLVSTGRYGEAQARLEESLRLFPDDREVKHLLVRLLAAAPDDDVRDGPRALRLAQTLLAADAPFEHSVAMAMVAAENGHFRRATNLQRRLIETARQSSREDLLPKLERDLDAYARGEPCREPWAANDPLLTARKRGDA